MTALLARLASHFVAPRPERLVGGHAAALVADPSGLLGAGSVGPSVGHSSGLLGADSVGPSVGYSSGLLGAEARGSLAADSHRARAAAMPAAVALICQPRDASALGSAIGLGLASGHAVAAALVCLWTSDARPPAAPLPTLALPAARRLAARLAVDGHDAGARGRLAFVRLPAPPAEATAALAAVSALARATPRVLVLAGPAARELDDALAEQDLVFVVAPAGADTALGRLAVAGLAEVVPVVRGLEVHPTTADRLVAGSGLLLPRALRTPVIAALTDAERDPSTRR
jgi:hypothetical protein